MRLLTSFLFLACTATAHAQLTWTDGGFASWTTGVYVTVNGSSGSGTVIGAGGNPGAAWCVTHQVTNLGAIGLVHQPTDSAAIFDPVTQGPFESVELAFDGNVTFASSFGNVVSFLFTAEQAGQLYFLDCSYELIFTNDGWVTISRSATAGEFTAAGGFGAPLDFDGGAPITFGIYTSNSTGQGGGSSETFIDNYSVTLQQGSLLGAQSCKPTAPNSVGSRPTIIATGSALAGGNPLNLAARCLPPNQFGYFLAGQATGVVVGPGGSQGTLCLTGPIGRFTALIQNSGSAGAFDIDVDTHAIPHPSSGTVAIQAGETWHFQAWYRDNNPGATSNFTGLASIQFL